MTYSEQRIVRQVTILPGVDAINVQWSNQVLRDGIVISETFERCAYTREQKDAFMVDVEGAAGYVAAIGW